MSAISIFSGFLRDEAETKAFAAGLAGLCNIGDCILLYGEVGAGKTSFARGFIRELSEVSEEITSPTFTIVQNYPLKTGLKNGGHLWHCDFYRLKHRDELYELGLEEAFENGITLIEWPEIMGDDAPKNALKIMLKLENDGRNIELIGNEAWQERLKKLAIL